MSYILDALRKADAQRERDPARGIHAQPAAVVPARGVGPASRAAWLAAAVVAAAAAAWFALPQRVAPPPMEPVATAPVFVPAPPAPVLTAATSVSPPAPAPLPPPVGRAPERVVAKPQAPVAAAAPTPDRIFAVADLPAEVQRDLPKLAISGGVHSENAAQRLLIVGGQVLNEGAELAPGVVLEQIRARTAVLRFRGYRYSVPY